MRKITMPREFYIPKLPGTTKVEAKGCEAVAYVGRGERAGKPYFFAAVFYGKQARPIFYYTYRTEEARTKAVVEAFASRKLGEAYTAGRRAEKKAFKPTWAIGSIFRTSWGYEQTNVEYYELVALKGKTGTLRQIGAETVEKEMAMAGRCVPLPGQYCGEAFTRRAQEGGFRIHQSAFASYMTPKIMAGVPVYESSYFSTYA